MNPNVRLLLKLSNKSVSAPLPVFLSPLLLPHPSSGTQASEREMGEGRVPADDHTHTLPPLQTRPAREGVTLSEWSILTSSWTRLLNSCCSCDLRGPLLDDCLRYHAGVGQEANWSQVEKTAAEGLELLHDCTLQNNFLFAHPSLSLMSCYSSVSPVPGVM